MENAVAKKDRLSLSDQVGSASERFKFEPWLAGRRVDQGSIRPQLPSNMND
jgi:hypothetical protein